MSGGRWAVSGARFAGDVAMRVAELEPSCGSGGCRGWREASGSGCRGAACDGALGGGQQWGVGRPSVYEWRSAGGRIPAEGGQRAVGVHASSDGAVGDRCEAGGREGSLRIVACAPRLRPQATLRLHAARRWAPYSKTKCDGRGRGRGHRTAQSGVGGLAMARCKEEERVAGRVGDRVAQRWAARPMKMPGVASSRWRVGGRP